MKINLAILAFATLAISACSSTSTPKTSEAVTPPPEKTVESKPVETAPAPKTDTESSKLAEQLLEMQKQSVYFDFDRFDIKPEYRELIQQRAEFMKAHGNVVVTLEGNADERGSTEYNLALGNKRANAVGNALKLIGVPDKQIKTASYGEEHPRLTCHEEQCWKENRRVDFNGKQGS